MYDIEHLPALIEIGHTGETNFITVEIDMTAWMPIMPNGIPSIVHILPGKSASDAYIASTTFEDNILSWTIQSSDLGDHEGTGIAQVWLEQNENNTLDKLGMSAVFSTLIKQSVSDGEIDVPDAQLPWLQQMVSIKNQVVSSTEGAEEAKDAAQEAQEAAENARDAAQAAANDFQGMSATITGLPAGSDPTINVTHTIGGYYNFGFSVPKGDKGDKGDDGNPADPELVGSAVTAWMDENITQDPTVVIDKYLVTEGAASDAKSTGTKLRDLATKGFFTTDSQEAHITTQIGMVKNTTNVDVDTTVTNTAYVKLTEEQEASEIEFDDTAYKCNLCYFKNGTKVEYGSWITSSPLTISSQIDHDEVYINVRKLSGNIGSSELVDMLSYVIQATNVGNLAPKTYVVPLQQNTSDAGKVLGIANNGQVTPMEVPLEVDETLAVAGEAADSKKTGDVIKELALNGNIKWSSESTYYDLASGMVMYSTVDTVDQLITSSTTTGFILVPKSEIPEQVCFDTTKYKANVFFVKNNYIVYNSYTTWILESPLVYTEPADFDYIGFNVAKKSGTYSSGELSEALYSVSSVYSGDLATKKYVREYNPVGNKVLYPSGFSSRLMPTVYFNGKYYINTDIGRYKISGAGEVWVATDGDDTTGTGTESNPYETITKALTQNAATINLKAGSYSQGTHYSTTADFTGKNIIGHGAVVLENDSSGHYAKVLGSAYIENIVFKHGGSSGPAFAASCTASNQLVVFVGCTFWKGASNGLTLTGIDAILSKCVAYENKLDGFNYHDRTSGSTTYIPNVLEIDCVAYNNGTSESGSDSCNGSTAHDGTKIVRLNGEYYSCYGGVIAEIARAGEEPTVSVNFGVLAHDSTGTGLYKASFWASINTKMYLYDCRSYGGDYDISAISNAKVVSWHMTSARDELSINEESSADVIIN